MMTRFSVPVGPEHVSPPTQHDPPLPGYGEHVPFYLVLERCSVAWHLFLDELASFTGSGVMMASLRADFRSEVDQGSVEVEVRPIAVGNTSFSLRCEVLQAGRAAATVEVVLIRFDYRQGTKLPLSQAQRDDLSDATAEHVA